MKKFIALLIAGVMSICALALCACADNNGNDSTAGDVDNVDSGYPQIPEGVTLNDVKLSDAIDKDAELLERRYASNNVIQDEYVYLNKVYYDEDSGKQTRNYKAERYINLKYLNNDGKIYGENHHNRSLVDKQNYVDNDSNEVDYEQSSNIDKTTFIKDGSVGRVYNKGNFYLKNNDNEEEVSIPLYLEIYAANAVEVLSKDQYSAGLRGLCYNPYSGGDEYACLPYSGDEVKANTEYKLFQQKDPRYLFLYNYEIIVDFDEYNLQYRDVKIKNYKSTFKADGTKMFFEYSYRADFKNYNNDKTFYSWEYKYATYLDTDAELTTNDFKDDYLTDEVLANSYYYDCDLTKVGKDFLDGKDAVIDILGGVEKPADGDYGNTPIPVYIASVKYFDAETDDYTEAFIYKWSIVDGKLVIKPDWENFDKQAEELKGNGFYPDTVDITTAKKYLVIRDIYIRDHDIRGAVLLYIPLN